MASLSIARTSANRLQPHTQHSCTEADLREPPLLADEAVLGGVKPIRGGGGEKFRETLNRLNRGPSLLRRHPARFFFAHLLLEAIALLAPPHEVPLLFQRELVHWRNNSRR